MRSWTRSVVIGLSVGAGIVATLALVAAAMYWYESNPTPPKTWPALDAEGVGVKASLITRWREFKVEYQFRVEPRDVTYATAFDSAVNSRLGRFAKESDLAFTVHLYHASGFELCKIQIVGISGQINTSGFAESLIANGSSSDCSASQYREG